MTEFKEALEKDIVVTDFFATWCGPCKVIAPKVEAYVFFPILHPPLVLTHYNRNRLAGEFPDVHFTKVDVDETPDVAQEYGIRAMPTFLIFKNGKKIKEVVGANAAALTAAVNEARG
jgi:thioredoxin 1